MWVLRFHCEAHSVSVPVTRNRLTVGRDDSNDVILPMAGISRRHCEFELTGAQGRELFVRDCGSRLGVTREERSLTHERLEEGDRLVMGPVWVFVQKESTLDWRTPGGLSPALPVSLDVTPNSGPAAGSSPGPVPPVVLNACIRAYSESHDWGARWRAILGLADCEILCRTAAGERCVLPARAGEVTGENEPVVLKGLHGTWTCRWTGKDDEPRAVLPTLLNVLDAVCSRTAAGSTTSEAPTPGHPRGATRLIGLDGPWEEVERLADSDLPILITGETGVGKEVLARAVHRVAPGDGAPFQVIHCAAIPETLFESELFGIQPNTATGVEGRQGKLAAAHEGTVLLDEVAEIPIHIQAKLLRVLEDSKVYPLGARTSLPVKVRWLSATNRDLGQAIERGTFREDLYYRLRGAEVHIPPLRQRRECIPAMVDLFLGELEADCGRRVQGLSLEAFRSLKHYPWPGNVRELKMELKKAYHLAEAGGIIQVRHLSNRVGHPASDDGAPDARMGSRRRAAEASAVRDALAAKGGNISRAADLLGVTRQTLSKHIHALGIDPRDYKRK